MRDADSDYPRHQPAGQRSQHSNPFENSGREDEIIEDRPRRRSPLHQREAPDTPRLPRAHLSKALSIGAVAGVVGALQGIVIVLANGALYRQAASYTTNHTTSQMPVSVATTILGFACLSLFISGVIYFAAGFIIGKVSVERRMGFIGGFVAGAVVYIISFIAQQIPGYPNAGGAGVGGNAVGIGGGLITAAIFLVVSSIIAGLIGLLGAWLATRRHPYYVGYGG